MSGLFKSTFAALIFSLSLFSFASFAHAQTVPGITDPITFQVVPNYPQPNETIYITAQSFSTDLDKAVFKWLINGKVYAQGVGLKKISLPSGKPGTLTTLAVEVSTSDFGVIRESLTFRPAEVTLVWQSDTYVPPFYKGKGLHAFNGQFKVTAIPEFLDSTGKRINPKDLIYTWKKNGDVDGDASGFGKDFFVTSQTSYLRDGEDISVNVSSPKDDLTGSAAVTVSPAVPEVVFYEDSPLYGIVYEKALQDRYNLTSDEITLRAELFNVSTPDPLASNITYDWTLNDATVSDFKNQNEITLRKTSQQGGQSNLGLTIQNLQKVLQGGQAAITILQ